MTEKILWGVREGDEDWQEHILSTNSERFEEIKTIAAKDGFGRFRISLLNLTEKPDFIKGIL